MVLGDYGRSPRMQYHSLSLADQLGAHVDVIAYVGSDPRPEVTAHPRIHLRLIPPPPSWTQRYLPRVLALVIRVLIQTMQMLWTMCVALPRPTHVLLQTPPCVPSFAVCALVCFVRRAKFVIDWHNFAYTLMALKMGGARSPLVRLAKIYEKTMGRLGHAHFAVTNAMATWLEEEWGIGGAVVLHDAPPDFFGPIDDETERMELLRRLQPALKVQNDSRDDATDTVYPPYTLWPREDQTTALVVSSTSWTPDEDFGILLDALILYDAVASKEQRGAFPRSYDILYPNLLVVVTGKGPQRAHYEKRMKHLKLNRVVLRTAWLESEDYPKLLGVSDLGVCLHTSSSGLDLPMKVYDMFGCGLPVLAARYDVIHELVVEDTRFAGGSVGVRGGVRLPEGGREGKARRTSGRTGVFLVRPRRWPHSCADCFEGSPSARARRRRCVTGWWKRREGGGSRTGRR